MKNEKAGEGALVSSVVAEEIKPFDLSERILDFAVAVVKMTSGFESTDASRHIGGQLLRSATSIGANYEEGRAAQSRADFNHKLHIALKEAKETVYWVRLAGRLALANQDSIAFIQDEGKQLAAILAKSLVTSKGLTA